MSFFHSFTDSLRQKWLQFFQVNRDWINVHMEVESVYTPDGGKRPPSYLILGVVNALEPKLAQLMLPFSKLNPDADTLIEVLDLHFDPDMALGNRVPPAVYRSRFEEESAVVMEEEPQDETLDISETNGSWNGIISSDNVEALEMEDDHEQTLMVPDTAMGDELLAISLDKKIHNGSGNQNSLDEFHHSESVNPAVDEFGDISFDEFNEVNGKVSSDTASHENGFADVMSDVWGDEETVSHQGEADHEIVLGEEELPSGSFDDSEIARLFPKA
ncbi:MAG: DUF5331 domain-containing protein [Stigonema ocellatum SAG 48.90 = DSM 106950]|nr:DUF5331 domain-containing protein [Stigonema ocellatum SAG 48.90 = DSM 106950]